MITTTIQRTIPVVAAPIQYAQPNTMFTVTGGPVQTPGGAPIFPAVTAGATYVAPTATAATVVPSYLPTYGWTRPPYVPTSYATCAVPAVATSVNYGAPPTLAPYSTGLTYTTPIVAPATIAPVATN